MQSRRTLITGSPDRTELLGQAFARVGDEPVSMDQLGPSTTAVDRYVQLGVTVPARGSTAVRRVHNFLNDGLLERFAIVERVLPMLTDDASVLLVAGNLPAEASAPDDTAARLLLLRVLAHAIRADAAPRRIRVRVLSGDHTDEEIVQLAQSGAKDPATEMPWLVDDGTSASSYADWRTQVLGMAQVEV